MDRQMIKPYNQIFKTIDLHNEIMRKFKQGIEDGTVHTTEPVIDELEYWLYRGGRHDFDQIIIRVVANEESYTILDRQLTFLEDYRDVGILVDFYLQRAITLAHKYNVPYRKEYSALLKKRYNDICALAEKITQDRISKGVVGLLTVFAKTSVFKQNPVNIAEYEDELHNTSGYCRPQNPVEYYSAMYNFLKEFYV